jgi:hypothetical protein
LDEDVEGAGNIVFLFVAVVVLVLSLSAFCTSSAHDVRAATCFFSLTHHCALLQLLFFEVR